MNQIALVRRDKAFLECARVGRFEINEQRFQLDGDGRPLWMPEWCRCLGRGVQPGGGHGFTWGTCTLRPVECLYGLISGVREGRLIFKEVFEEAALATDLDLDQLNGVKIFQLMFSH